MAPVLAFYFQPLSVRVKPESELELELIQTHMTQKPMLRAELGMRVRCANNARQNDSGGRGALVKVLLKFAKSEVFVGCGYCALRRTIKRKARKQRSS